MEIFDDGLYWCRNFDPDNYLNYWFKVEKL